MTQPAIPIPEGVDGISIATANYELNKPGGALNEHTRQKAISDLETLFGPSIGDHILRPGIQIHEVDELEQEAKPGIYLELYHGRSHPDAEMEDWGSDCPHEVGPLKYVVQTYANQPRLLFPNNDELWMDRTVEGGMECHLPNNTLIRVDDMLYLNGTYYGDWAFKCR